jgi:hypothetical protein
MPAEHLVRKGDGSLVIELVDEPLFGFGSQDNHARYQREEILGGSGFQLSSRHGVISMVEGKPVASVIFGAPGGASGVHTHSLALLDGRGFLAVGPFIVCFALPLLTTCWVQEVDQATCFGIHVCPDRRSLISHGELEISRLTLSGNILWQGGGRDVFSGTVSVRSSTVVAEDFNGDVYSFDLQTGAPTADRRPTSR